MAAINIEVDKELGTERNTARWNWKLGHERGRQYLMMLFCPYTTHTLQRCEIGTDISETSKRALILIYVFLESSKRVPLFDRGTGT